MMEKGIKKVAFHTLGCKLNYAETSTISRRFEAAGYEKTAFKDPADLYVINTCSVTENADREFRKIVNRAKRTAPHSKIAVVGCYAQLRPEVIAESAEVDLVLGTREKFNILDHLSIDRSDEKPVIVQDQAVDELHGCIPSYSMGDRTRSFLKIQDGCDYPCTYCTIPLARGGSRCLAPEQVIEQAREIVAAGVLEIVLTGVNVGEYISGSTDLDQLLGQLEQVDGLKRLRISSIEPNLLTDQIIERTASSSVILPHFHIPLQSGSDEILRLMKRRYRSDLYLNRIEKVRELIPHAGIGSDVIVGFPGEDDEQFNQTYDLLRDADLSYLHVFTYSERPDTAAIELDGRVPMSSRKNRNRILTELSERKAMAFGLGQVNKDHLVLAETVKDGMATGMTENYIRVHLPVGSDDPSGQIVEVELTGFHQGKFMATYSRK